MTDDRLRGILMSREVGMSLIAAAMMGCEFSAPEDVVVVDTGLESADVATGDDDTAAGGSQTLQFSP